jgi:hypothetical protein
MEAKNSNCKYNTSLQTKLTETTQTQPNITYRNPTKPNFI